MIDSLFSLLEGFLVALTWQNLLYCFIGVMLGMIIGILPGLGPVSGTALLIPITFGMEPVSAIIMLSGIFYGSMYGGTITSVLVNVPGEAASVITCIDGYEMTKQGCRDGSRRCGNRFLHRRNRRGDGPHICGSFFIKRRIEIRPS